MSFNTGADLSKDLNTDFNLLNDKIEARLRLINDKVNERLDENFEKTNKTFTSVIERLSKIDEAQKKIETLSITRTQSEEVVKFEQVMDEAGRKKTIQCSNIRLEVS